MAQLYTEGGWEADAAALDALAAVKSPADFLAVRTAVRSLYLPWLKNAAEHFQKLQEATPLPTCKESDSAPTAPGKEGVVIFADRLRWDLALQTAKGRFPFGKRPS